MKRVLLSITATIVGIVALLSYKTHAPVATAASGLPSAGLPGKLVASSAPPAPVTATGSASVRAATSPSVAPSTSASSASFTGAAVTTPYGIVQVKVTVVGKKITKVAFAQLTAFDGRSQRINSGAAPILLQETLQAQSAQIDSVSGASYTSQGYDQSLQSALDQAGI